MAKKMADVQAFAGSLSASDSGADVLSRLFVRAASFARFRHPFFLDARVRSRFENHRLYELGRVVLGSKVGLGSTCR